jgi:zinc transport system ATP-binding protein
MDPVLTVEHLSVRLDKKYAIQDLSFRLDRGENLCVIGPNGSGKTVLLKTLLNLFRYTGTIKWAADVRIGYVPQRVDIDRQLPLTYNDLIAAKCKVEGTPMVSASSLWKNIGLSREVLAAPVGQLSGGQFQRGLIALALIGQPNVLMFDEPTAGVDMPGEEHLYELVHRLQEQYQLTVITVSHDLSVVSRYASKVLCLKGTGRCFGEPAEALAPEIIADLYGAEPKYYQHIHRDE